MLVDRLYVCGVAVGRKVEFIYGILKYSLLFDQLFVLCFLPMCALPFSLLHLLVSQRLDCLFIACLCCLVGGL